MAYLEMVHNGIVYTGSRTTDITREEFEKVIIEICRDARSQHRLLLDDGSWMLIDSNVAKQSVFLIREEEVEENE